MTQPFLYIRNKSTTHSAMAVFKDIDGTLVQVGTDFGTGESTAGDTSWNPSINRVIHWQNDIYAVGNQKIWKYDVANSGDWDVFYSFASYGGSLNAHAMGLHPSSINGVPVLVTMYPDTTTLIRAVYIDTDGVVTEGAAQAGGNISLSVANGGWRDCVSFGNKLYWTSRHLSGPFTRINAWEIDLATDTAQLVGYIGTTQHASNLCVLNSKVFAIGVGPSNIMHLYRIDGNSVTDLGSIQNSRRSSTSNYQSSLVAVTGCLYATYPDQSLSNSIEGLWATQIILDEYNNISQKIDRPGTIPDDLYDGGAYADYNSRVFPRIDNISNNGRAVPTYEFDVTANGFYDVTPRRLYTWNGDMDTQWTFILSRMDAARYSYITQVCGSTVERVWSGSGTLNAEAPTLELAGTNINATFKVYGAGQSGVKAELIFDKEGEVCNTVGTLDGTSIGSLSGNIVTGLVADGTTEVAISWAAAVDGIATGDNPKVAIRVFI